MPLNPSLKISRGVDKFIIDDSMEKVLVLFLLMVAVYPPPQAVKYCAREARVLPRQRCLGVLPRRRWLTLCSCFLFVLTESLCKEKYTEKTAVATK